MLPIVSIAVGMAILVVGAEALVRGASRIANAAGISPLVIGLTVVAFGTSAPELAVSVGSALAGNGSVAVGNAVGSNIFNVLAILGLAALFGGLVVHQRIVRIDVPLLLVATGVVWAMAADGRLSVLEGCVLLVGIVGYTVFSYLVGRREGAAVEAEYQEAFGEDPSVSRGGVLGAVGLLAIGLRIAPWEGVVLLLGYIGYVGYQVSAATAPVAADAPRALLLAGLGASALLLVVVGLGLRGRSESGAAVVGQGGADAGGQDREPSQR